MSNLKDLVPPLELCKLIPNGEFCGSVFAWWQCTPFEEWQVVVSSSLTTIPAPTLEEIWKELPDTVKVDKWGGFHIINDVKNGYGVSNTNGATAALKLWLKLKGN